MKTATKSRIQNFLEKKKKYLIPCVYHFYKSPMLLKKGKGVYLYDDTGKKYLDAYSGVGVVNCGHSNPKILKAVYQQLRNLQHTTTIYITEPLLRLAERLARFIPGKLRRSFFCTSGSEANEGAMLLAKLHTGRTDFMALRQALHGRTYLTSSVTGISFWRTDPEPAENVHFIPSPTCHECPLGLKYPSCKIKCADEAEKILNKYPNRIAALITESVHGNGGIQVPPREYFERLEKILKKHGVLLIIDEAQTGFCRTGKKFGFQHFGIQPDILTVCKALANGLPISAFITTDEIAKSYIKPGASTFGGTQTSAAAALATLDFMDSNRLDQRANRLGALLKKECRKLQKKYSLIFDVRGLGLMLGLELRRKNGDPAARDLDRILEALKDRGVLAGKTGKDRNVLTFMPPLVITESQIKFLIKKVTGAFNEILENPAS
ncbi:MAG: aspartate aminotransferase family protein [Candidatus Omnitrophica bacterium]|nr:aspartate aminotransferase family protein [Candidatus Omnitrophota bacterium]